MTDLDKAVERLADEQDGLLHKTIKRLKGHVVAMSDGKKLVARGEPGPSPNPIMACLADLPEIVRHLEAAEFDIEAALEEHEAALSAKSAELAKAREAAFRAGWAAGFEGGMGGGPLPDQNAAWLKYSRPQLSVVEP